MWVGEYILYNRGKYVTVTYSYGDVVNYAISDKIDISSVNDFLEVYGLYVFRDDKKGKCGVGNFTNISVDRDYPDKVVERVYKINDLTSINADLFLWLVNNDVLVYVGDK